MAQNIFTSLRAQGVEAEIDDCRAAGGWNGSGKWKTTSHGDVFVKIGTGGFASPIRMLTCELKGLSHLHRLAEGLSIKVPAPVCVGSYEGKSDQKAPSAGDDRNGFIAIEYIDFERQSYADGNSEALLGHQLALLHSKSPVNENQHFGFELDGCCGAGPQPNNIEGRDIDWVSFWREYRLGSQLHEHRKKFPDDTKIQELGAQLSKRLDDICFSGTGLIVDDIEKSGLHGDMWSGNVGFTSLDGVLLPCIFDPAFYYGHAEADLGIVKMFNSFSGDFFKAYHEVRPKQPGFAQRALLYELHHHMNHMNIFGAGYRPGVLGIMTDLLNWQQKD